MTMRRKFAAVFAAGAVLLAAGCSTGSSDDSDSSSEPAGSSNNNKGAASDIRIDVITHGSPGDSFWDVVKAGATKAGDDLGIDFHYQSDGDPGEQATLIDNAVAAGTDGIVVSMANPDGLESSVQAAVAAGIPVVTINAGGDKSAEFGAFTHIGQDETVAGNAAGEKLNDEGLKNVLCVIQEAGNVALETRCSATGDTFSGDLTNLQVDNTDLAGSEATIESKLQADPSIDGVLTLGGDMSGQAVKAVQNVGRDVTVATFDVNADVVKNVQDGNLLFAIDQQPFAQGYVGVTAVYLNIIDGLTIGGGQAVLTGPAFVTADNADAVAEFAAQGTR